MTAVNPFVPPGRVKKPMVPLHPVELREHDEHYVDVCGSGQAYQRFQEQFSDRADADEGGYVLVVGDSGCGKTALRNRCAFWAESRLGAPIVVSLPDYTNEPRPTIDERLRWICKRLGNELRRRSALVDGVEPLLAENEPDTLLPELGSILRPGSPLVVLLPTPEDLVAEVRRFAQSLRSPRVLYLVETAMLAPEVVDGVERDLEHSTPLTVLRLRTLEDDEAARFIADRLTRNTERGEYPRITDEAVAVLAASCQSVLALQKKLQATYKMLLTEAVNYTEHYLVTAHDLARCDEGPYS